MESPTLNGIILAAAYMAVGANAAADQRWLSNKWDRGHNTLIYQVTAYASLSDSLSAVGHNIAGGSGGVFNYEVDQEFGRWMVEQARADANADLPDEELAVAKLGEMAFAFFARRASHADSPLSDEVEQALLQAINDLVA